LLDAHCHLLNLELLRYPWIESNDAKLSFLLANYFDIARNYGPSDYRREAAPAAGAVACEFGADDHVAEATWVQAGASRTGIPQGFVAGVDLTDPGLGDTLARYRDLPVVRAVRQPLYWDEDPRRRLGARPDFLRDPAFLRGFEQVAAADLAWDLLLYGEQLDQAHELLGSFPETRIVLEACGWPLDQSEDGFARWADRLGAVAAFPNVTLKCQGLALIFGPSAEVIGPWLREAVTVFGPQRCMFASHFPVDHLLWSFEDLVATLEGVLDHLDAAGRDEFFGGCARRT
jgi:predicted TIM-barrel fold metal-dependent hydrolase